MLVHTGTKVPVHYIVLVLVSSGCRIVFNIKILLIFLCFLLNRSLKSSEKVDVIVEAFFKECKKSNLSYKKVALISTGDILETLSVDKFSDIYSLVEEILAKVNNICLQIVSIVLCNKVIILIIETYYLVTQNN